MSKAIGVSLFRPRDRQLGARCADRRCLLHRHGEPQPHAAPASRLRRSNSGNPAAPFLNSLMTPGNPNAAQTSYASNYHNAAAGVHPSLPNYLWQEAGHQLRREQRQPALRTRRRQPGQCAEPQRPAPGQRHLLEVVPGRHRHQHDDRPGPAAKPVDRPADQFQRHVHLGHESLQRQPPVQLRDQARRAALLQRHQRRQRHDAPRIPRPPTTPRCSSCRPT